MAGPSRHHCAVTSVGLASRPAGGPMKVVLSWVPPPSGLRALFALRDDCFAIAALRSGAAAPIETIETLIVYRRHRADTDGRHITTNRRCGAFSRPPECPHRRPPGN